MRSSGTLCAMVAVAAVWCVRAPAAQSPDRVRTVLQTRLGFTGGEITTLERGHAIAKSLRADDRQEIAAAGAVRVAVPMQFFLKRFVDIVSFKQSPLVRQIGKFSDPPRPDDLAALTFESADIEDLESCREGRCDIQLSASQLRRIHDAVAWSRPDARAQADRFLRAALFEYIEAYRRDGNQALLEYANERDPLSVADEVRALVANSAPMLAGMPEFAEALYANGKTLPGSSEFLYWSKEQFGLKPVVTITHVIIYHPRRPDLPDSVIASKQIYASRYLAGSLALTLAVEAPGSAPSFFMAYANRSRSEAFPPVIGGLVRRIVQDKTRDGLEEQLLLAKSRLEGAFRAPAKPPARGRPR